MQDQTTRAAHLTAIAQPVSPAPVFADLGSWMVWSTAHLAALKDGAKEEAHSLAAELVCDLAERSMRPRKASRVTRAVRMAVRVARKVATA